MFVFVWSSQSSRLRALPQDLRTRLFVSGFTPNTCVLPWKGRGCLVRHPLTPPAVARGHRLVLCCHRQCILPVGTICCRSALFFGKMTFLPTRLLFSCFLRYFKAAVLHLLSLHTRVWRDELLGGLTCKFGCL